MPDKDTASAPMGASLSMRAVACKRFRLMPGMVGRCGWRVKYVSLDGSVDWGEEWTVRPDSIGDWLPDFDDPATLGCLLALVREAWGDRSIVILRASNGWYPSSRTADMRGVYGYASELEALIAALEAAP